jgi:hypothetical protein
MWPYIGASQKYIKKLSNPFLTKKVTTSSYEMEFDLLGATKKACEILPLSHNT